MYMDFFFLFCLYIYLLVFNANFSNKINSDYYR